MKVERGRKKKERERERQEGSKTGRREGTLRLHTSGVSDLIWNPRAPRALPFARRAYKRCRCGGEALRATPSAGRKDVHEGSKEGRLAVACSPKAARRATGNGRAPEAGEEPEHAARRLRCGVACTSDDIPTTSARAARDFSLHCPSKKTRAGTLLNVPARLRRRSGRMPPCLNHSTTLVQFVDPVASLKTMLRRFYFCDGSPGVANPGSSPFCDMFEMPAGALNGLPSAPKNRPKGKPPALPPPGL